MKFQNISHTAINASRLSYGCMEIAGAWTRGELKEAAFTDGIARVQRALDANINFFDHADIYGGGKSEELFSHFLKKDKGIREKIYIQSKCGIRFGDGKPARFDFSRDYIISSVEGILKRLGIDYLDVLLLHRPDALVEPEEVARAIDSLYHTGKIRHFGVSNHSAAQMALLSKYVRQPIVVNQLQLSLLHHHLISDGVAVNQLDSASASVPEASGTIEYCREHDITIQAWGPLDRGIISKHLSGDKSDNPRIERTAQAVEKLCKQYKVAPETVQLAWLLRHPAKIQPIIGTGNPQRLKACCAATELTLSREDWYGLLEASRGKGV